ncbi:MAG: substrate-binding domain-containing protein [Shewanella sp.]
MYKLALLLLCLCVSSNLNAQFFVITHDSNAETLSESDLRLIFSKQRTFWQDGQPIRVFILPPLSSLHQDFCRQELKLMPYFLQKKWDQRVFSGTGDRPEVVNNEQDMWQKVKATPGAIGYLSSEYLAQGNRNGSH